MSCTENLSQLKAADFKKEIGGKDSKYGYLRNQKSMLLLPNAMNIQTINLAGLDNRMQEKIKTANTPGRSWLSYPKIL